MISFQEKDTRRKILESTKLILAEGKVNLSMSEIAKKSGVTKSALYYFFKNKKELILAVMQSTPIELTHKIENISKKNVSAKEKISEVMEAVVCFFQAEKLVSQNIFRQIFAQDEELLQILFVERKKGVSIFQKIIEEGVKTGEFRKVDSEKTAEVVAGFLDFLCICLSTPCPSGEKKCQWDPLVLCNHLIFLLSHE